MKTQAVWWVLLWNNLLKKKRIAKNRYHLGITYSMISLWKANASALELFWKKITSRNLLRENIQVSLISFNLTCSNIDKILMGRVLVEEMKAWIKCIKEAISEMERSHSCLRRVSMWWTTNSNSINSFWMASRS